MGKSEAISTELRRPHLHGLDGLRAIAALLVVFGHGGLGWKMGGFGVLIFFVLSGFLITWLLLAEAEQTGTVSLRDFYIRRSLRIFPAFYVYWFLIVGLLLWRGRLILAQAICSFFYVNNYYQAIFGDPQTGLSHTWTLGVEEQFYLLWPFLFLFLKNNVRRINLLMVAVPCLWIYREIMVVLVHVKQNYVYEAFDMRADHLLLGCLLALVLYEHRFASLWQFLRHSAWMPVLTVVALAAEQGVVQFGIPRYRDWGSFVIEPVLVAILISQLIALKTAPFTRLLELPFVRYLGKISYSIYLYQQLVIHPIEKRLHGPYLLTVAGVLVGVIACASASYFVVERPFLMLKKRFEHARAGNASGEDNQPQTPVVIAVQG